MKQLFSKVMILGTVLLTSAVAQGAAFAQPQPDTLYFPQTQQSVSGRFLEYWTENGGLMQQGYPISPEIQEQSPTDGKIYKVQYFERAVFELHPENNRPYDVLLSLLGVLAYQRKYPTGVPNQRPNEDPGSIMFTETGKRLGGSFLVYFNAHGGITQQGLPISDEFQETSELDGKTRTVQYFERAVFEWNPSNQPPYNVLLSQLGTFAYKARNAQPSQPPVLEPVIPPPSDQAWGQYLASASSRYLVWYDGYRNGFVNIRALDLQTNRPITVTSTPGIQASAAIDGATLAWQNTSYGCQDCAPPGIYVRDLAKGTQYQVADNVRTPGWSPTEPAVAGTTVAWLENGDNKQRILAADIATGTSVEVRSVLTNTLDQGIELDGLVGSGRFLVWDEFEHDPSQLQDPSPRYPYSIQAYDLTNNRQFTVLSGRVAASSRQYKYAFSLSGNRLAVSDKAGNLFVIDLATNARIILPYQGDIEYLALFGDKLLFSTNPDHSDVYGIDLSSEDKTAVVLLKSPLNPPQQEVASYQAVVVGDWLVWGDATQAQPRLNHEKLKLTPPAPSPVTPASLGIPAPPPDQGQYSPVASDRYLVWQECRLPSEGSPGGTCSKHGLDLQTKREVAIDSAFDDERAMTIDGSMLAWSTTLGHCPSCTSVGIYARDLSTGTPYTVITGGNNVGRGDVGVSGRTVGWIERDNDSQRVMTRNLDTSEYKNIQQTSEPGLVFDGLQMSPDYLVWHESYNSAQQRQSRIKAYDRHTGKVSTIFAVNQTQYHSPLYALDGHRIAIKYVSDTSYSFYLQDLQLGVRTDLAKRDFPWGMELKGNTLVFAANRWDLNGYPSPVESMGIYAIDLEQPDKIIDLVEPNPSGTDSYSFALSGRLLIYSNRSAQKPLLNVTALPDALP